jgi:hypothetical protein
MASRRLSRIGAQLVLLLVVGAVVAAAATIDVGTATQSNWLITGAGATNAAAVGPAGLISVSSNGLSTGTFVAGGSLASFTGFWEATDTFFIPAGATGVELTFSNFAADDRAVLELNGVQIGNTAINGGSGAGAMCFSSTTPCGSFTFGPVNSGVITSGFTAGADNTLTIFVNNTTGNLGDTVLQTLSTSNGTAVQLVGDVSFSEPTGVPEPGSYSLFLLGLVPTAIGLIRRRSS